MNAASVAVCHSGLQSMAVAQALRPGRCDLGPEWGAAVPLLHLWKCARRPAEQAGLAATFHDGLASGRLAFFFRLVWRVRRAGLGGGARGGSRGPHEALCARAPRDHFRVHVEPLPSPLCAAAAGHSRIVSNSLVCAAVFGWTPPSACCTPRGHGFQIYNPSLPLYNNPLCPGRECGAWRRGCFATQPTCRSVHCRANNETRAAIAMGGGNFKSGGGGRLG